VRRALDDAADALDTPTRRRLQQARLRELDALARPTRTRWGYAFGGVAAAGVAAVLGALLWINAPPDVKGTRPPEIALSDIELLSTKDGPELLHRARIFGLARGSRCGL